MTFRQTDSIVAQRDPKTYALIGTAMEVHRQLGAGFLEAAYQSAFEIELQLRGIPFRSQKEYAIRYKGHLLSCGYRVDICAFDDVIVELKAVRTLGDIETAQLINYLRASGQRTGLLLNFGRAALEYKRYVHGFDWGAAPKENYEDHES
jgi:GxxExxY protein